MSQTYPIVEIFTSIQGEGIYTGVVTTFVRFAGCNLTCEFCDTKESWDPSTAKQMTIPEILEQCTASRVVLTGGEPTLYHLTPLIEALKKQSGFSHKLRKVAIETNGTRALSPNWNLDWVTCSPKAPKFDVECRCDELKYVVTDDFDAKVIRREAVSRGRIFLQPESHRFESMQKAYKLAMMFPEYLRVGLQMHKVFEVR